MWFNLKYVLNNWTKFEYRNVGESSRRSYVVWTTNIKQSLTVYMQIVQERHALNQSNYTRTLVLKFHLFHLFKVFFTQSLFLSSILRCFEICSFGIILFSTNECVKAFTNTEKSKKNLFQPKVFVVYIFFEFNWLVDSFRKCYKSKWTNWSLNC